MTDHPDEGEPRPPDALTPAPPNRPGASIFTIEGRAAPALFVIGWLGFILGAAFLVPGFSGPRSPATAVLIIAGLLLLSVGLICGCGSQALERRARGAAYAGPSPFLLVAASIPVGSLGAILVGLIASVLRVDPNGPAGTFAVLAVIQLTYLALTRLLVVGVGALSWAEMGFRRPGMDRVLDLGVGIAYALPIIVVTGFVAQITTTIFPVIPESPLPPSTTTVGLVLNLLGGAVLVPIGEETIFRGVATTAWQRSYGTQRAIVQGALFFAFVHVLQVGGTNPTEAFQLAIVAFVARIPVGLALGWLFLSRKSIWASIGLHGAFNGILLTVAHFAPAILS